MPDSKLIDRFNRNLNYLRISITDRCNLRCVYCRPDGFHPKIPHSEILRYEEILRLVKIGVGLGISKVRVTGGEPLIRKGAIDFIGKVASLPGLKDISLTTNGVLLKEKVGKIKAAGVKRINISLDTLERDRFLKITGHDNFQRVWDGIEAAEEAGFSPIKINVVVLRGINDDELERFAALTLKRPFHIRFIELMPIGDSGIKTYAPFLATEIKERLEGLGGLMRVESKEDYGPAERYRLEGAVGEIGLIRPISHHFCHKCNRLRLTARGAFRACLLSDHEVDVKTALRTGKSDEEITDIFFEAVRFKPMRHNLRGEESVKAPGEMSAIGG